MLGWFKSKSKFKVEEIAPKKLEWIEESPEALYHYFYDTTGIHFDQKIEITTSKLIRFAQEHHSYSFSHFLSRLKTDQDLFQHLVNFLTVNETYFFREIEQVHYMLGEIKKQAGPIRILCAPGSTGEEPYTIAIALNEAGIEMNRISIISIDINTEAILAAQAAVYSKRSLHRVNEAIMERYFYIKEGKYHLCDLIRNQVEFKAVNLFEANVSQLGTFDYLFSRNMMIYFDRPMTALAITKLLSLARSSASVLFFGHADIVTPPCELTEHHVDRVKFYTPVV